MAMGLFENETLEKKIFDAFLSETEVADNASNELRAIRIRIRKLNDNVRSKLQLFITSPHILNIFKTTSSPSGATDT